ncbi:hypothetical protein K474DRAFT_390078 [Panus rudis PR-1116 ss-1]|nr:hypothetical protein K474DRAFT_390078 [Panus rudis PR-1116 ss-1]
MTRFSPMRRATMSITNLPQEILDYIIDYLHDDYITLRSCGIVCRACISASRHHLFHEIVLDTPSKAQAFYALLCEAPYIGQLVRALSLTSFAFVGDRPAQQTGTDRYISRIHPRLLTLLPRVQRLEIQCAEPKETAISHLVHAFPAVTDLSVRYCTFLNLQQFARLVQSFPLLSSLTTKRVCYTYTGDIRDKRIGGLDNVQAWPTMRSLRLETQSPIEDIFSLLAASRASESQIRNLTVSLASAKDVAAVGAFVMQAGHDLERYRVECFTDAHAGTLTLPPETSFSLKQCTRLKSFVLDCPIGYDQKLPWVADIFSRLNPASLETVDMTVRLLGNIDAIDWCSIGNTLSRKEFHNLHEVSTRIILWSPLSSTADEIETKIRSELRELEEKGVHVRVHIQ